MLTNLKRQLRALAHDPVLRQWIVELLLCRSAAVALQPRHHPPYLDPIEKVSLSTVPLNGIFFPAERASTSPDRAHAELHGIDLTYFLASPSRAIFDARPDLEFALAIHRFAWLPIYASQIDDESILRVWHWWSDAYARDKTNWPWHPYTASERALNILDVLETRKITELETSILPTLPLHIERIESQLEYYGESATGNHLANNGRGLYRLGLALDDEARIRRGLTILRSEIRRSWDVNGFLREGSSHYQLLTTKWLLDVWRWALRARRLEAEELGEFAKRALAASCTIAFDGILPLIGDISPDSPPADLNALIAPNLDSGWIRRLPEQDRNVLRAVIGCASERASGPWLCGRWNRWRFLSRACADGWNPIPGHGHQDLGGFALYRDGEAIVVDPGRGAYGEGSDASFYRSAGAHSVLEIDGHAAYPLNRGRFSQDFRDRLIPAKPSYITSETPASAHLVHEGFRRLRGVGAASRRWCYDPQSDAVEIEDAIEGSRSANIVRRIIVAADFSRLSDGVLLKLASGDVAMRSRGEVSVRPIMIWHAYGEGRPGSAVEWRERASLPYRGSMTIKFQ